MKPRIRICFVPILCTLALGGLVQTAVADTEANKAVEHRVFEEIWNQGALEVADEVFAPDAVLHGLTAGDLAGPAAFKQVVAAYRAAIPDIHWTVDDQIAEGDTVVSRLTGTGTQQGALMGIPPTGLKVTVTAIATVRIADGKVQESWNSWDAAGLMEQLGALPATRAGYAWGEPSKVTGDAGDAALNRLLILRFIAQFWNGKDIAGILETHSAEALAHNPVIPGSPLGFDAYQQACLAHVAAFPDFHVDAETLVVEADRVAVRWTVTGTHRGELMGVPPSGKAVKFDGVTIYRLADGKVVETWWAYDALGMMQQITSGPERTPEGTWIVTVPSPMGNLTFLHVIAPPDASGRHSGVVWQVNANPTFFGTFPEFTGGGQFWASETVRTGPNSYETGMVVYGTLPVEGLLEQIGSMSVANITWTITGPDTNEGQAILSTYVASQDADGDGLPDESQEPTICTPFPLTSKRMKIMPPCVPAPVPQ